MSDRYFESRGLEEALKKNGVVIITGRGVSMMPLIKNSRDRMCAARIKDKPKKHDILIYRGEGEYIAHRLVGTRGDKYLTCGDNQIRPAEISPEDVVAYLPGMVRKDRYVDFSKSSAYRLYVLIWCSSMFLRRCMLYIIHHFSASYKKEYRLQTG